MLNHYFCICHSSGQPKTISLEVPSEVPNYNNQLWVSGVGAVTFNHTQSLNKAWKTKSVFIQTSQGIYKPESLGKNEILLSLCDFHKHV